MGLAVKNPRAEHASDKQIRDIDDKIESIRRDLNDTVIQEGGEDAAVSGGDLDSLIVAHEEQLRQVEVREAKLEKILKLTDLKNRIARSRDRAAAIEWDIKMAEKRAILEKHKDEINMKREEQDLERALADQQEELINLRASATATQGSVMGENPQPLIDRETPHSTAGSLHWQQLQAQVQQAKKPTPNTLTDVQTRARELMSEHAKKLNAAKKGGKPGTPSGAPPSTAPLTGWQHLHQLNIATQEAMQAAGQPTSSVSEAYTGKTAIPTNPLRVDTSFPFDSIKSDGGQAVKPQEISIMACSKDTKVKSGKFAKSHVELIRQEVWPHTAVSKKYVKRGTFDNLDFDAFVAGEAKIVYSMLQKSPTEASRGMGRLRVLVLVAHWFCRSKNWPTIRAMYENIIEEVEQGDSDWTDDFSGHETMLPSIMMQQQHNSNTFASSATGRKSEEDKKSRNIEIYWCKGFQTGTCELSSPHMAQVRPDEPQVPVIHICASCWNVHKKKREHPEGDPSCPTKKGGQ